MRITGLATGLDMDEIVKNSMKPYRIKIDKKGQDKEILEIKQKLYREVLKDSRDFYNKYFDIASSNSLLLSKNWSTVKFTSLNENLVTVTGSGDAKADSYTVSGKSAKASQMAITEGIEDGEELVINGETFKLEGDTAKERANNLNNELKAAGINVSVKHTDFAATSGENQSGFLFESTVLGEDSKFTISGYFSKNIGTVTLGVDATASTITKSDDNKFTMQDLRDANGKIKIGDKELQLQIDRKSPKEIQELLQDKLKDFKITAEVDESGEITFRTTELGSGVKDLKVFIGDEKGKINNGEDSKFVKNTINFSDIKGKKVSINGNLVDLSEIPSIDKTVEHINKVLKNQNIDIGASVAGDELVLSSNKSGVSQKIDVKVGIADDMKLSEGGQDANITIKNSSGRIYTHKGISNTVTVDGIEFKFNGDISSEAVTINGKQDVTVLKDNLVNFFNDYNTLVEKLNTLTMEKKNRDFSPLTADQKKEMSADEIKLWNEKVEKGQLSRDSDLSRINNSLKQAISGLVDGTGGLNLEKIGISPVADYSGSKNGIFTIDENKLIKALEQNSEEIMDMFIKTAPEDDSLSEGDKYSKTGMMNRVKDIIYNETFKSNSALLKKVGLEGTASAYNNNLTVSIQKYEQKMKDMEKDFSRREQALYSKYATLETMMNKYNSQQSYLMQQLGLG